MNDRPIAPILMWQMRARLKELIRGFFSDLSYLEVDTPALVLCPGTEAHLGYFSTEWEDYHGRKTRLWLRSSPELHMKQVLAQGPARIFQFASSFRNGGELSPWHHPEFCMLEWYQAHIPWDDYIKQTEALICTSYEGMKHTFGKVVAGKLPETFRKIQVFEAFQEFAGLELLDLDPDLARKGKASGIHSLNGEEDFETAFFKILLEKVEPALQALEGAVLYGYPPSQAALARVEDGLARRFEFYWRGVELCNGFHELVSPELNRFRIQEANNVRKKEGRPVPGEDPDFYLALESGLPDCCGNALGFERLLALILGQPGLGETLPLRNTSPWKDYSHESGILRQ